MAMYLGVSNNGTFVSSDGYKLQDNDGLSLSALPANGKLKIILNGVVYRFNIKLPEKKYSVDS
jgi:hypothetical protein